MAIRENIVLPQFFHLFLKKAKLKTFRESNIGTAPFLEFMSLLHFTHHAFVIEIKDTKR